MNRNQLVILLVLLVAIGALGLVMYQRNQSSWESASQSIGQKLFKDLPVNDVATIIIQAGTNELHLVRKDGLWRVQERNDYPANFAEISGFLLKAADLKAAQSEEIGPSQLGRYKLLPPGPGTNTAVRVELRDPSGKPIQSLLLGKQHMRKGDRRGPQMGDMEDSGYPDGRYVMVGAGAKTVAVVSDPLSNLEPRPEAWLNKDFFKVEKIESISVTFPAATNSWKVSRDAEAADWKLADPKPGEQLDSSKTSGFSYALSSPTFTDVLATDAKPEQTGLDKPTILTLTTFDHFTYTLKVGAKTNENYALTMSIAADLPKERTAGKDEKAEDKTRLDKEFQEKQKKFEDKLKQEQAFAKWTYLVPAYTLDSLLKERSQLLVEKKEEPKKEVTPPGVGGKTPEPAAPWEGPSAGTNGAAK